MKPLLPFVPTPDEKVAIMLKFADIQPGQKSVDLGAGDGKIVIAMAKMGAIAYGFEIQQKYARRAKAQIARDGLIGKAFVTEGDFWQKDLSEFDIVTVYGMALIMDQVSKKLTQELKDGTKVISNGFPVPGWRYEQTENHVYLYSKG